jgi:hypothetical protein
MRRRLPIAAALACIGAMLLAANTSADPQVCTEIGCSTGIYLHLQRLARQEPEAAKVRFCALGECKERRKGDAGRLPCPGLHSERRARLRVVVYDDYGGELWRDSTWLQLVKNQPNGPDCPPTCFQASASLFPHAQEVRPD